MSRGDVLGCDMVPPLGEYKSSGVSSADLVRRDPLRGDDLLIPANKSSDDLDRRGVTIGACGKSSME